ncbi:hypothetical protein UY3_01064 [Chelonia mydas]|uniref:Uncharacterized protein n=1 Tax=Chelonia mydas TaxID=8469 RepID=M7BWT1_CHEMY|nr:hypothetical protein UY3_01064 [Chelonia mydas]
MYAPCQAVHMPVPHLPHGSLRFHFLLLFVSLPIRNRKIILMCEQAAKPAEPEAKPPFVDLKEDNNLNPFTEDLLPKEQRPGEVLVQWKDGTLTALYAEKSEEDM